MRGLGSNNMQEAIERIGKSYTLKHSKVVIDFDLDTKVSDMCGRPGSKVDATAQIKYTLKIIIIQK